MSETMEMKMMRAMAWERAKGELRSMLVTYNNGPGIGNKFHDMDFAMQEFIKEVEDNELQY